MMSSDKKYVTNCSGKKGLDMKCQTGLHPLALIKLSERYRDTEKKGLIREIICSFILQSKYRGNKAGLKFKYENKLLFREKNGSIA